MDRDDIELTVDRTQEASGIYTKQEKLIVLFPATEEWPCLAHRIRKCIWIIADYCKFHRDQFHAGAVGCFLSPCPPKNYFAKKKIYSSLFPTSVYKIIGVIKV